MKQRLCLAKTLVHDPEGAALDEPASGLDPRARIEIKELLKELKSMGKTIIISSHILPELADFCTSVGIIERGELIVAGPIDAVLREVTGGRILEIRVPDADRARACEILPNVAHVRAVKQIGETLRVGLRRHLRRPVRSSARAHPRPRPRAEFRRTEHRPRRHFLRVTKGLVA
jgi:ABC-2 type transport system ATP-binding protein